jgi:head-tail adaptor
MTNLISADKLAKMQAVQESHLPETAYIQQLTATSDGAGGFTEVWATMQTVDARLGEPKGEMEREIAAKITTGYTAVITLPAATVLLDTDQIQINTKNYKVHWQNKLKSNLTALRVVVTAA